MTGIDARRLNHSAARQGVTAGIGFLEIDGDAGLLPGEALFDLALGFAYGPAFEGDAALGRGVARRLSPDGLLCVLQRTNGFINHNIITWQAIFYHKCSNANFIQRFGNTCTFVIH